jgi:hypothetical protein
MYIEYFIWPVQLCTQFSNVRYEVMNSNYHQNSTNTCKILRNILLTFIYWYSVASLLSVQNVVTDVSLIVLMSVKHVPVPYPIKHIYFRIHLIQYSQLGK